VGFSTTPQVSVGLAILWWAQGFSWKLLENKNKQDNVGMGDKKMWQITAIVSNRLSYETSFCTRKT
jgi:hypothetical protein